MIFGVLIVLVLCSLAQMFRSPHELRRDRVQMPRQEMRYAETGGEGGGSTGFGGFQWGIVVACGGNRAKVRLATGGIGALTMTSDPREYLAAIAAGSNISEGKEVMLLPNASGITPDYTAYRPFGGFDSEELPFPAPDQATPSVDGTRCTGIV